MKANKYHVVKSVNNSGTDSFMVISPNRRDLIIWVALITGILSLGAVWALLLFDSSVRRTLFYHNVQWAKLVDKDDKMIVAHGCYEITEAWITQCNKCDDYRKARYMDASFSDEVVAWAFAQACKDVDRKVNNKPIKMFD